MGWADQYIKQLRLGANVSFRPTGDSMYPEIRSGQKVYVDPIWACEPLDKGDIVLCEVQGRQYLHFIKDIRVISSDQFPLYREYLIGNNRGGTNGWIPINQIYGKLTKIEKVTPHSHTDADIPCNDPDCY